MNVRKYMRTCIHVYVLIYIYLYTSHIYRSMHAHLPLSKWHSAVAPGKTKTIKAATQEMLMPYVKFMPEARQQQYWQS